MSMILLSILCLTHDTLVGLQSHRGLSIATPPPDDASRPTLLNGTTTHSPEISYSSFLGFFFGSNVSTASTVVSVWGLVLGVLNILVGVLYACSQAAVVKANKNEQKYATSTAYLTSTTDVVDKPQSASKGDVELTTPSQNTSSSAPADAHEGDFGIIADGMVGVVAEGSEEMPPEPSAQQKQCQRICQEIIETERAFAANMDTLHEVFYNGLKQDILKKKNLIPATDLANVFQFVEPVLRASKSLLRHFDDQDNKMNSKHNNTRSALMTARVIRTYQFIMPFLKVYGSYCNHYDESMTILRQNSETRQSLKKWLEKARHNPRCRGLNIADLLIQPVQRICKYPLLFGELLKNMDANEDSDLRKSLEDTCIKIKAVASLVDRRTEDKIKQNKMAKLLTRLSVKKGVVLDLEKFITPTRFFEFEIKVDILDSSRSEFRRNLSNTATILVKHAGVHLLLLSDILLLAFPRKLSDVRNFSKHGTFDLECPLKVIFASSLREIKINNISDYSFDMTPEQRVIKILRHQNVGTDTNTEKLMLRFATTEDKKIFLSRVEILTQNCFMSQADLGNRRAQITKKWAKKKTNYLHNKTKSRTISNQLDNMAIDYRQRKQEQNAVKSSTTQEDDSES